MDEDKKQKALTIEITEARVENAEVIIHMKQKDLTTKSSHQQMVEENEEINRDIKKMIEISEDGLFSRLCCIYMVPPKIRLLKEKAYTPNVVSIGPFHHGNEKLKDMERHKHIMFKRFVKEAKADLDSLVKFAKLSEPEVRASYFGSVDYGKKDLVKLIIVDAAFIIQLFIDMGGNMFDDFQAAKLSKSWLYQAIGLDLLLLENQLPFFFLEQLYDTAFPLNRRVDLPSFLELTYSFFQPLNKQDFKPGPKIKHFTDLLRLFYLPRTTLSRVRFKEYGLDILPFSANELKEVGVKLKQNESSKCLLDLKFEGSVLEIPQILVEDGTETLFRNLIALEQCHYPCESYFTDYIFVMDSLVNTSKDVEVLSQKKIIDNWLSDADEVATLFNGLGKNVLNESFNVNYLGICKRLNKFYHNPCHRAKATLRRDYCKTRWQTVASIAGILLLILTLIQTIFSILQVVLKQ